MAGHNQSNVDKEIEMCRHGPSSAVQQQQQQTVQACARAALRFYGCFLVFLAPWGRFSTRNVV